MAKPKLTKSTVEALEPRHSDYVQYCGQLPGFGCRVQPSGFKSFVVQYDFGGRKGVTRKMTLGQFGKITVEDARKAAIKILANAELGIDVAGEQSKRRSAMNMGELCDEYVKQGCRHKKASTIATDLGRIERHIKPLLGQRVITEITKGDISRFKNDVAAGKTAADIKTGKFGRAIVTGGEGTATRTLRLLGGIFSYAVEQGYIATNPRTGVKGFEEKKCERFLAPDEIARLGETLRLAETEGLPWQFQEGKQAKHRPAKAENQREIISPHAVAAIRLLLLTGARLSEILKLQWQHISEEHGVLNLPTSKTGKKVVYLGAPELEILAKLPRVVGNPYVIVGEKADQPRRDLKRPWKRVTAHAGLPGLRLHDLRHTNAAKGAGSGMGLLLVGKLLGHLSPSTTERYAHIANDHLRQASQTISQTIMRDLSPIDNVDNVVPIKK